MSGIESYTKPVLLTLRQENVDALDRLVGSGVARNRSELVDRIVGGFIADLRNQQQTQTALGNLIGFILMVVGIAAILKALGGGEK